MANTLVVAGDIEGSYGATHNDEDLVVPLTMHPSCRPSLWKNKKVVVLGLVVGVTTAVVVSSVTLFFSRPRAARIEPSSVLLQHYSYVTITNKTPLNVLGSIPPFLSTPYSLVSYLGRDLGCRPDFIYEDLPAGQTWTASSRGICLVNRIQVTLGHYRKDGSWHWLWCAPYISSGTSHSIYSVLMNVDDDACCVRSSHESQRCEGDDVDHYDDPCFPCEWNTAYDDNCCW